MTLRAALAVILTTLTLVSGAACGTPGQPPTPARTAGDASADLDRQMRRLEAKLDGRIGAFAVDTATGKSVGHRTRERFPMLSTFKAMAAAAILRKGRESDPGLLDRVVRWKRGDLRPNSPVTEKHMKSGLTVAELCRAAVAKSDNTAANLLLKQLGGPSGLTGFLRSIGDRVSRLDRREPELNDWKPGEMRDTTTPESIGRDLSRVTVGDALDARDRKRLIGWLKASATGDKRIRAGLPKKWIVGDKTGTGGTYGTANDIAIAWSPSSPAPIIIAVYTNRRGASADPEDKIIANTATLLVRSLGR